MRERFLLRPRRDPELRVTLQIPVGSPGGVPEEAVQLGLDNEGLFLCPLSSRAGQHCGQGQTEERERGQHGAECQIRRERFYKSLTEGTSVSRNLL